MKKHLLGPLFVILAFAAGCGEETPVAPVTESPPPVSVTDAAEAPAPAAPEAGDVMAAARIVPQQPTCRTELSVDADKVFLAGCELRWTVNGMEITGATGLTFTSEELRKGDVVSVVIVKDGVETQTGSVIIGNTPPTVQRAHIEPREPSGKARVYAEVYGSDPDGDTVTYRHQWRVNGESAGEESFIEGNLKRGDLIEVDVVPFDGTDTGPSVTLKATAINNLPSVQDGTAEFDGENYRYTLSASDPDGDALQYALVSGPEGMAVDPAQGLVTWVVPENLAGTHRVEVDISDGNGGRVRYAWDVALQWEAQ